MRRWYGSARHDLPARLTCQDARVVTSRTALAGAWLVLAMLTAGACQQVNEAINDRDLECGTVPEDICARLADHIAGDWDRLNAAQFGPIVTVSVTSVDCGGHKDADPAMARCWLVDAQTSPPPGSTEGAGSGGFYYQRDDGTLVGPDGPLVGS